MGLAAAHTWMVLSVVISQNGLGWNLKDHPVPTLVTALSLAWVAPVQCSGALQHQVPAFPISFSGKGSAHAAGAAPCPHMSPGTPTGPSCLTFTKQKPTPSLHSCCQCISQHFWEFP